MSRTVFKIVSLDLKATEVFMVAKNLRSSKSNQNSSTNDVKWNPHADCKHLVCTAAMNGSIVLWNVENSSTTKQGIFYKKSRIA